jgi:hypothetical protein
MSIHGGMNESDWEQLALDTLAELAWYPSTVRRSHPAAVSGRSGRTCTFRPACSPRCAH